MHEFFVFDNFFFFLITSFMNLNCPFLLNSVTFRLNNGGRSFHSHAFDFRRNGGQLSLINDNSLLGFSATIPKISPFPHLNSLSHCLIISYDW